MYINGKFYLLPLIAIVLIALHNSHAEVYTALADMEELLHTETVLIDTLQGFIDAQERKLAQLRIYVKDYQKQHDEASPNVEKYLANPINAYLLVKRLTSDWRQVETMMSDDVSQSYVENITNYRNVLKFPTDEDLSGAAVALMRLQDTYHLDTSSLARGEVKGFRTGSELTVSDCFELGRQSYNNGDHYHTVLWMREAYSRLGHSKNETVTQSDILEYLAFSTYMQGNIGIALQLTNKLLEMIPTHTRALGNKAFYEKELGTKEQIRKKGDDDSADNIFLTDELVTMASFKPQVLPEKERYEKLCRGEESLPIGMTSKLKCLYVDNGIPYRKIGPFKVEEAYLSPRIVIYHDIIHDSEIETIKKMAQPRFKRATVQNYQTGELEVAQYRISKSAWLKEHEHRHVDNVCQRTGDMANLSIKTAEELQVVNYGIGGHYEPHYDFARREETNAFKNMGTGNRIATVLFYMSDVEQGGATVFVDLGVALWPKKGTAAFWHNLYPSGEGDLRTRHAACPVLTGSKWVSNKWFHERDQEFKRPCEPVREPSEFTYHSA